MKTGFYDRELFTLLDSKLKPIFFHHYIFFFRVNFIHKTDFYDDGLISRVFHCRRKGGD